MGWAYVQGAGATGTGAFDPAATLPAASAVGNLLVAGIANFSTPTTVINDSHNTWTKAVGAMVNSIDAEIWYCINAYGGGPLTITANGDFGALAVDEFAPPSASPSPDATSTNSGTSASASTGDLAVSGYDLAYAVASVVSTEGAHAAGPGYTPTYSAASSSGVNMGIAAEYALDRTSGPVNPGFAFGAAPSAGWTAAGITFRSSLPPALIPYGRWSALRPVQLPTADLLAYQG